MPQQKQDTPDAKMHPEGLCCGDCTVHSHAVEQVATHMLTEQMLGDVAEFFKAFSDKTRVRILSALAVEELCVCDIADLLGMTQSAISHQLRYLKQARLVKNRKEGKTVYYALCDNHIYTILAQGIAHIQE